MNPHILTLLLLITVSGCTCQIGEGNRLDSPSASDRTSASWSTDSRPAPAVPTSEPATRVELLALQDTWQQSEQQTHGRINELEIRVQRRDRMLSDLQAACERQDRGQSALWLVLLLQFIGSAVCIHRSQL